jgi:hypothetical protein
MNVLTRQSQKDKYLDAGTNAVQKPGSAKSHALMFFDHGITAAEALVHSWFSIRELKAARSSYRGINRRFARSAFTQYLLKEDLTYRGIKFGQFKTRETNIHSLLTACAKGKHHVQHVASLDTGDLDRRLIGEILSAIKEALLLNSNALALLEFFLDRCNSEVALDVKGMLASGDCVDLDLHFWK